MNIASFGLGISKNVMQMRYDATPSIDCKTVLDSGWTEDRTCLACCGRTT